MVKYIFIGFFMFQTWLGLAQTYSDNIKVDQFGYVPRVTKIAVISQPQEGFNAPSSFVPGSNYQVVRRSDSEVVYTGEIQEWNNGLVHQQSGDKVWWFDFSEFQEEGLYYIVDPFNNVRSHPFRIASNVYSGVLKHAVRFFYYQRCGISKETPFAEGPWIDGACHIHGGQDVECYPVTDKTNESLRKDLSGGWHDAGDYNKYTNFTNSAVHQLLDAYEQNPSAFADNLEIPESGNGIPDVLDEIKWELDWLLKMQLDNGSALMKVSVTEHQSGSPPSTDRAKRYYGEASASSTITVAGIFAHASIVFSEFSQFEPYADTLLARAEHAWNWLQNNPGYSNYDNTGFKSANPEHSEYDQDANKASAAVYLYAATNDTVYRNHFDGFYKNFHSLQWGYWYPYESHYQDAMLYYTNLENATPSVVDEILHSVETSVKTNNELLPAYINNTDAYRAYLKDDDYVWGSNSVKLRKGSIYQNMILYQQGSNIQLYNDVSSGFLHYIHGVNPVGIAMLTNMYGAGAERPANEMYHGWFGDGTAFDNAIKSEYGPAPGYVTGGMNKNYHPDAQYGGTISPPEHQPVQKAYKDWNTSWPENSWEITEPAIYYQASYIKLLSKFVPDGTIVGDGKIVEKDKVEVFPNPASSHLYVKSGNAKKIEKISIIDLTGKVMLENYDVNNPVEIQSIRPGYYIVKIIYKSGNQITTSFIKT